MNEVRGPRLEVCDGRMVAVADCPEHGEYRVVLADDYPLDGVLVECPACPLSPPGESTIKRMQALESVLRGAK